MKYTSMANTIRAILESRALTPVIGMEIDEPLEDTEDTEDTEDAEDENSKARLKLRANRSIKHQTKLKIIDNI